MLRGSATQGAANETSYGMNNGIECANISDRAQAWADLSRHMTSHRAVRLPAPSPAPSPPQPPLPVLHVVEVKSEQKMRPRQTWEAEQERGKLMCPDPRVLFLPRKRNPYAGVQGH